MGGGACLNLFRPLQTVADSLPAGANMSPILLGIVTIHGLNSIILRPFYAREQPLMKQNRVIAAISVIVGLLAFVGSRSQQDLGFLARLLPFVSGFRFSHHAHPVIFISDYRGRTCPKRVPTPHGRSFSSGHGRGGREHTTAYFGNFSSHERIFIHLHIKTLYLGNFSTSLAANYLAMRPKGIGGFLPRQTSGPPALCLSSRTLDILLAQKHISATKSARREDRITAPSCTSPQSRELGPASATPNHASIGIAQPVLHLIK